MKSILLITAYLHLSQTFTLERVIKTERSNDSLDTLREFHRENPDPERFLQNLALSMYQQLKMSKPEVYSKINIVTTTCEHSMNGSLCPVCTLMRKTIVMNVPDDSFLNFASRDSNLNDVNLEMSHKMETKISKDNNFPLISLSKILEEHENDRDNSPTSMQDAEDSSLRFELLHPENTDTTKVNHLVKYIFDESPIKRRENTTTHGEEILRGMSSSLKSEAPKSNNSQLDKGRIQIENLKSYTNSENKLMLPDFLQNLLSKSLKKYEKHDVIDVEK